MSFCLGATNALATSSLAGLRNLLHPFRGGYKQGWLREWPHSRGACFVLAGDRPQSVRDGEEFVEVKTRDTRLGRGAFQGQGTMTVPVQEESQNPQVKLLTLVIIEQNGKLLLGMKKRGFGEGYYNGFGGKVEAGETIEEAAARELQEEAGIAAVNMVRRGVLTFHFDEKPVPWEVHVFHAHEFTGEPCETEEMSPIWFSISDIPYDRMWKDDVIWYPPFLNGEYFRGDFFFKNTHELVSHSLKIVPTL